jgi:hypothetical protein
MALCAVPAAAQDATTHPVNLEVEGDQLSFTRDSSCEEGWNRGDVCIRGGTTAEIVFTLGRGSEEWEISEILIRDPAANWRDPLPGPVASEFRQFDQYGVLRAPAEGQGGLVVAFANGQPLAVQYAVSVRNRDTGAGLAPAFAVIDGDGGAALRGE